MGNPVITRSISSDGINPAGHPVKHVPYVTPEEPGMSPIPSSPHRASWGPRSPAVPVLAEENGLEEHRTDDSLTIEEALQIIHDEGKLEPRLHPDGAPDGFFLHSPEGLANHRQNDGPVIMAGSAPEMQDRPHGKARHGRRTSDGSRDDDSVLRDGSVDSDASEDLPKTQSTPSGRAATPSGQATPDSGVKMTSFAERKKKLAPEQPAPSEPSDQHMTTWAAKKAQESPSKSPALNNEMSELGVRLEEKRKAIEAQKRRIEAIFAKHRQRLGKSAFLQLKKDQVEGDGEEVGPTEEARRLSLDERLARIENDEEAEKKLTKSPSLEEDRNAKSGQQIPKDKETGEKGTVPLGDYNNAVTKLNAALSSLQSDMQRLSEQQQVLMKKKNPANEAWVIPPSTKTSTPSAPPRISRQSTRDTFLNSASSSPSPSHKVSSNAIPPKSPSSQRRAQSVPPKSPKSQHHTRTLDSKMPPLARVITAPHSVDNIPHRRKVSPWQYRDQNSASFSITSSFESRSSSQLSRPEDGHSDSDTVFSMDLDGGTNHHLARKEQQGGTSSGAPSECSFESDAPSSVFSGKRGSLIEIPLSSLRNVDIEEVDQIPDAVSDSMSDQTEPEMKGGVGFFFKVSAAVCNCLMSSGK